MDDRAEQAGLADRKNSSRLMEFLLNELFVSKQER